MAAKVDGTTQQPILNTGSETAVVTTKSAPVKSVHTESTLTSADTKKEEKAAESSGFLSYVGSFFTGLCSICSWLYNLLFGEKSVEKKEEKPEEKGTEASKEAAAKAIAAAALASKGTLSLGKEGKKEEPVVIITETTGVMSSETAPANKEAVVV